MSASACAVSDHGQEIAQVGPRLIGTWRSDRRRTFEQWKPRPGVKPQRVRRFKSIFGKLVIRWGRTKCYTEQEGHRDSQPYEIVATDENSVIVRSEDAAFGGEMLLQIYFVGKDHYYVSTRWGMIEWFRRVKS